MTDLDERHTTNLAHHRLRAHESELRTTVYGPNPAAETLVIDHRDGALYRYSTPTFTPLGHGPDAWILDLEGHAQPAAAPPQPATAAEAADEPCGCCILEEKPFGKRGRRRRLLRPSTYVAAGALVAAAVYSGLVLAALAVLS